MTDTKTPAPAPAPAFEAVTCGRCGGSGHYSFNMMHGTRCYGCAGSGWKLTPRGAAAREHYRAALLSPVESAEPGRTFLCEGIASAKFRTIHRVTHGRACDIGAPYIVGNESRTVYMIQCGEDGPQSFRAVFNPGDRIRLGKTAEEKRQALSEALAYQSTLTKTGKLRKGQ